MKPIFSMTFAGILFVLEASAMLLSPLSIADSSPPIFSERPSNHIEYNIDRWGADYRSVELSEASPSACLKACSKEAQCLAWTYVKPVNQNSKAMCWLKDDIPEDSSDSRCVSGIMRDTSVKWLSQFVQYDQKNFAIAHNNLDDEFLVVWEDHHEAYGEDWDIFGQRLDKRGDRFEDSWGIDNQEFAIASKGPNERRTPDIVFNPLEREYLIAWSEEYFQYSVLDMDHVVEESIKKTAAGIPWGLSIWGNAYYANNAEDMDIRVRKIDAAGKLSGPEVQITDSPNFEIKPKIAFNTDTNEYLIIWEDHGINKNSSQPRAYGQLLTSDGSPIGDKIEICASDCKDLDVAYGAGWYFVVWSEKSDTESDPDIRGCWLDSTGRLSGSIDIETWEFPQLCPRIAFNNELDEFFVVWEDHHWGWGKDRDIFGRRISAGGTFASDRMGIAYKEGKYYMPEVTYNPNFDSYLVVYFRSEDSGPTNYGNEFSNRFDIKSRYIAGDGGYYGPQRSFPWAWDTVDGRNAAFVATNNENAIGDAGYGIIAYGDREPCKECYGDHGYNLKKSVHYGPFGTNYEYAADRWGSDYRSFDLQTPEPELCAQACENESQCKAWTYVKPGGESSKARCWLKHSVPEATVNRFCVSGVAQKQPTQPSPPLSPITINSFTSTVLNDDYARLDWSISCNSLCDTCNIVIDHLNYTGSYKNLPSSGSKTVYRDRPKSCQDGEYILTVQCGNDKATRKTTVPKWPYSCNSSSNSNRYYIKAQTNGWPGYCSVYVVDAPNSSEAIKRAKLQCSNCTTFTLVSANQQFTACSE